MKKLRYLMSSRVITKPLGFYCLILLILCSRVNAMGNDTITYDLVLSGGTVMDPESGLNAIRNIGIINDQIAMVSINSLHGNKIIDVTGLIVAPGFIDLHAHGQNNNDNRLQIHDGVTTALELEDGMFPINGNLKYRTNNALINFGYSVSHLTARAVVLEPTINLKSGTRHDDLLSGPAAYQEFTDKQIAQLLEVFDQQINDGALGIGLGLEYTPGVGRKEVFRIFQFAAQKNVSIYVHIRRGPAEDPSPEVELQQVQEIIALSAVTGATVHVAHLPSSTLNSATVALELINLARKRGVNITTEAYPYMAGSTAISSALFDENWQQRLGGIDYSNIIWAETGERLTKQSFDYHRSESIKNKLHGNVIIELISEESMNSVIADANTIVASDGGGSHPRSTGSFSKVLGKHVRIDKRLSLMDAIRKMTLLPAQQLEKTSSMMKKKGRIKMGADADIVVFDANTITDNATYRKPFELSTGIHHVFLNGHHVIKNGQLIKEVYVGNAIVGKHFYVK